MTNKIKIKSIVRIKQLIHTELLNTITIAKNKSSKRKSQIISQKK